MRLPETGKRKYGLEVLKGRNQLCHGHTVSGYYIGRILHWRTLNALRVFVFVAFALPDIQIEGGLPYNAFAINQYQPTAVQSACDDLRKQYVIHAASKVNVSQMPI